MEHRTPHAAAGRPTLRSVAEQAGVSVTAASQVVRGVGRLSDSTRQRVQAAVDALGYRPHRGARSLRTASTGLVGLVARLPAESSWGSADLDFLVRMQQGFCTAALERGLFPVILSAERTETAVDAFGLDGVLLVDPVEDDPLVVALDAAEVPLVTLGRDAAREHDRQRWVDNSKSAVTRSVLEHLLERGMRSVLLVTGATGQNYSTDVRRSFEEWVAERDVSASVVVVPPPFDVRAGHDAVREACDAGNVDTVYLNVETFLQPTLEAIAACGLRVPDDVQLVMATDSPRAAASRPSVSAVDLHPDRLGREGLSLLLDTVAGAPPRTVVVDATFRPRESTR